MAIQAIKSFFSSLWSKYGSIFRSGLEAFVAANLRAAIQTALRLLAERKFFNTDEFVRALWQELRGQFPDSPGTWLALLANFACEALKKDGKL